MLSPSEHVSHLSQLPMADAGQLLLVMGISFIVITLLCSTYKFHK